MATTEEKERKFKELAIKRTNRIMDDLRLLGNLANKSNYEYGDEQVEKIFSTLEKELKVTKKMFGKNPKKGSKFTL